MPDLITPIVHRNGDTRETLTAQLYTAYRAVSAAVSPSAGRVGKVMPWRPPGGTMPLGPDHSSLEVAPMTTRQSLDDEIDQFGDALARIHGKGTLADLLDLIPGLEAMHRAHAAAFGWRACVVELVMLGKLQQLQRAVAQGILNPEAHMMALNSLGLFTSFQTHMDDAYALMKDYLLNS